MLISEYQRQQYAELHKSRVYGHGEQWAEPVALWAQENGFRYILDYGCGRGTLVRSLQEGGFQAQGYDPAVPEFAHIPQRGFDAVVSVDVLEHIEPDYLDTVLSYIHGAGRGVFLNISTRRANIHLPDGQNAHAIVRPAQWWMERMADYWPEIRVEHRLSGKDSLVAVAP